MKKISITMTKPQQSLGWVYYIIQFLVLPNFITLMNVLLGSPLSDTWANFVFFCINFLCIIAIFHPYLGQNAKKAIESPFLCLQSAAVGIVAYWFLSYMLRLFIIAVCPDFFNINDTHIGSMVQDNYGLMAFGTVFLVPVVEEVFYRGLMFGQVYNWNRCAAYIISIAVFAAVHVISYIGYYEPILLLLCFLQYLPAGLCLSWAYARADTIWAPILMHIAINQVGILTMR